MCKKYTRKDYNMKENDRLEIINKVKELKDKRKKFIGYKRELGLLLSDPKVKRYIELTECINSRKDLIYNKVNGDEIIYSIAFSTYTRENKCTHDIWIYVGSYYDSSNSYELSSYVVPNEQDRRFEYNIYACLDCDKRIEIKDYKRFESEHFVLKSYKFVNIQRLREYYYKLLSTNKVENANKKLIKEFKERY